MDLIAKQSGSSLSQHHSLQRKSTDEKGNTILGEQLEEKRLGEELSFSEVENSTQREDKVIEVDTQDTVSPKRNSPHSGQQKTSDNKHKKKQKTEKKETSTPKRGTKAGTPEIMKKTITLLTGKRSPEERPVHIHKESANEILGSSPVHPLIIDDARDSDTTASARATDSTESKKKKKKGIMLHFNQDGIILNHKYDDKREEEERKKDEDFIVPDDEYDIENDYSVPNNYGDDRVKGFLNDEDRLPTDFQYLSHLDELASQTIYNDDTLFKSISKILNKYISIDKQKSDQMKQELKQEIEMYGIRNQELCHKIVNRYTNMTKKLNNNQGLSKPQEMEQTNSSYLDTEERIIKECQVCEERQSLISTKQKTIDHLRLRDEVIRSCLRDQKKVTSDMEDTLDIIKDKMKHLEKKLTCIRCKKNQRNIVFLPCRHNVVCWDCYNYGHFQNLEEDEDSEITLVNVCPKCGCTVLAKFKLLF